MSEPKPNTPYLLLTSRGPQLAEYDDGAWQQWLNGDYYGISVKGNIQSIIEIETNEPSRSPA